MYEIMNMLYLYLRIFLLLILIYQLNNCFLCYLELESFILL